MASKIDNPFLISLYILMRFTCCHKRFTVIFQSLRLLSKRRKRLIGSKTQPKTSFFFGGGGFRTQTHHVSLQRYSTLSMKRRDRSNPSIRKYMLCVQICKEYYIYTLPSIITVGDALAKIVINACNYKNIKIKC